MNFPPFFADYSNFMTGAPSCSSTNCTTCLASNGVCYGPGWTQADCTLQQGTWCGGSSGSGGGSGGGSVTCPVPCKNNGTCVNGVCQCTTGWSGSDCSISSCTPKCPQGTCGVSDGCQGTCACDTGYTCVNNVCKNCVPYCPTGSLCGSNDNCGGKCTVQTCTAPELCVSGTCMTPFLQKVYQFLPKINNQFLVKTANGTWVQSKVYKAEDMFDALVQMVNQGINNQRFLDFSNENVNYGLVNLAAFLAQCMKETIMYDACDENNWSMGTATGYNPSTNGKQDYPLSAACGQLGQSYQDYDCPEACPLDKNMEIIAQTNASWYGAPGPLFCAPKTAIDHTGYWNTGGWCDTTKDIKTNQSVTKYISNIKGEIKCQDYVGQKAGFVDNSTAIANCNPTDSTCQKSRTDVENCCWWGRGVIQTSGRCNFGKLNKAIGAGAGSTALFPNVDLCKDPEAICKEDYPSLKWIAGFFYWMNSVQNYESTDKIFNYVDELKKFVNNGMNDNGYFIGGVSGIVNRGCYNPPCGTGPLDGKTDREKNFQNILKAMSLI